MLRKEVLNLSDKQISTSFYLAAETMYSIVIPEIY